MTIMIKGCVMWKNTEDAIVSAAVNKYGENQWARISSLLVRKSPNQCESRWYEFLKNKLNGAEKILQEEDGPSPGEIDPNPESMPVSCDP